MNANRFVLYPLSIVLCPLFIVQAQTATIRGIVTDATTTQPMVGVTITMKSQDGVMRGTLTDPNGYFLIGGLLPDKYIFKASFVGYLVKTDSLNLNFGDKKIVSVQLRAEKKDLGQIVITAQDNRAQSPVSVAGMQLISPSDMRRLPSMGVMKDLAQYLAVLPGFIAPADRGGQLYVRGGTPTQNQVLLDGIPIYQPFHILGSYSAFSDETIARADVYSGGFGARYGGRISSVIDVASRNGNKQRFQGSAALDPILSGVRIEGPLKKNDVSFLLSWRESVVQKAASQFLKRQVPFQFGDRFLRLHAFITPTSSISFTGLQTDDAGDLRAESELNTTNPNRIAWQNQGYGLRFFYLPDDFPAILDVNFSKSAFQTQYGAAEKPARFSNITSYRFATNFDYILKKWEMRFGIFIRTLNFQYQLERLKEPNIFNAEAGLFVDASIPIGKKFHIEPGIRLHTFPGQGDANAVEPRFRAAFSPNGQESAHKISLAFGTYHQQIIGLTDTKDIGEVFFAFAPSKFLVPQATHYLVGWQNTLGNALLVKLEGYYKTLRNITSLYGNLGFVTTNGVAKGLDLQVKWEKRGFLMLTNYSLAHVLYETNEAFFAPAHDRRHNLNLSMSYRLRDFMLNARWQYGSGYPFTQFTGFDNALPISANNRAHFTSAGTPRAYYDAPFLARLPAYNRLDLTAEYVFSYKRASCTLFAGAQNVYNRNNLFFYDIEKNKRIDQMPFLPSIGLKMEVK